MQKAFITLLQFLVKCTLLYDPLCLSVCLFFCRSVRFLVALSHLAFFLLVYIIVNNFRSFYILSFSLDDCTRLGLAGFPYAPLTVVKVIVI